MKQSLNFWPGSELLKTCTGHVSIASEMSECISHASKTMQQLSWIGVQKAGGFLKEVNV
jgi:flavin-binding protein dodecin